MINIIIYQIDGNKSKSNLSTHLQAYVFESFLSKQPYHALWNHQLFLHDVMGMYITSWRSWRIPPRTSTSLIFLVPHKCHALRTCQQQK
jgi:hypothetical protein